MPAKAAFILEHLSPGKSRRKIQSGQVILLTGDPDDMEARVVGRHKQSKADLIGDMQSKICRMFVGSPSPPPVNTLGLSIYDVIKRVARIILLDEYKPTDFGNILTQLQSGGLASFKKVGS